EGPPVTHRYRWLPAALSAAALLVCSPTRHSSADPGKTTCPVNGGAITVGPATPRELVNGNPVYFCCNDCIKTFRGDPEKYLLLADKGSCPLTNNPARGDAQLRRVVNNHLYYLCCE